MEKIKIDRYDTVLERGAAVTYAVAGKKRILMPSAFQDLYNEDHLAIAKTSSEMNDVLGLPEGEYYIPLRTAGTSHGISPRAI